MKISLGANILSLMAQRGLRESSNTLSQVYERLASGQRINRASDDPAGLSLADNLRAEGNLYSAALRNISDGISVLNVMDAALDSQSQIITRLRELAEQSANGVYTATQRDALNQEYQALVKEFGRIGDSTRYNGMNLLSDDGNGNQQTITLQVGINGTQTAQINLQTQNTGSMSGTLNPNGNYLVDNVVDAGDLGVFALAVGTATAAEFFNSFGQNYFEMEINDSSGAKRKVYGLITVAGFGAPPSDAPGFLSLIYEDSNGIIQSAANIDLSSTSALSGNAALTFSSFGTSGQLSYDLRSIDIFPSAKYGSTQESALDFTGVNTQERALHALDVTARRLDELGRIRGDIGAVLSRLDVSSRLTLERRENLISAEARIRDTDIAFETARLVQSQILQQVSAAILAQANQQPLIVLKLLENTN